jgi:hypothetical protein
VSEAKWSRQLEEENRQLKHTVAELLLDSWTNGRCRRWSQKNGEPAAPEAGGGSDALGSGGATTARVYCGGAANSSYLVSRTITKRAR